MVVAIIVVAILLTVGLVVWFTRSKHPEKTASHHDEESTADGFGLYGNKPSGPAGADVDQQDPDQPGSSRGVQPPS